MTELCLALANNFFQVARLAALDAERAVTHEQVKNAITELAVNLQIAMLTLTFKLMPDTAQKPWQVTLTHEFLDPFVGRFQVEEGVKEIVFAETREQAIDQVAANKKKKATLSERWIMTNIEELT